MPFKEIFLKDIVFNQKVQEYCVSKSFTCPSYGKSWSCPPVAPYLEKKIKKYERFFLVYSAFEIKEYIKNEKLKHPTKSELRIKLELYYQDLTSQKSKIMDGLEKELNNFFKEHAPKFEKKLVLWAGTCRLCLIKLNKPCSYIDGEPCRFPKQIRYSMEAVGIEVLATAFNSKVDLDLSNNEYRFALVCLK
ncbi:MAG: DUF2284 domain-containing protein [Promethearchaeota archaeon]